MEGTRPRHRAAAGNMVDLVTGRKKKEKKEIDLPFE